MTGHFSDVPPALKLSGSERQGDSGSSPGKNAGGVTAPSISLPKGGGAIRGIGEKFAVNPANGTGSTTLPIETSPARGGSGPQLSLSYNSGTGNGPFGLGWSLSLPSIMRKTDKGLPQYRDSEESDVFILSGAEDLVPVQTHSQQAWQRISSERTVDGIPYRIYPYRPRVEGLFARIDRWLNLQTGESHWRSISRDNITTLYGSTPESRIASPADPARIFGWMICQSYDDKGNATAYRYVPENADGVDRSQANERNRSESSRSVNRLLKKIQYGNLVSRLIQPDLALAQWMFEVVFDYGDHDPDDPKPGDARARLCRHDPFSTYRPGFEVRTYRLCQRVLMFHHFPDEPNVGQDCLVRSTDFVYRDTRNNPDDLKQGNPVASFIASATQTAYRRKTGGGYDKKAMPPLEFEYSDSVINDEIQEMDAESLQNMPAGLDSGAYQWIDLDGEGVSGILTQQSGAWFYKPNLGDGHFGPVEAVAVTPSLASLQSKSQQLLDVAGDGQLDLVEFGRPTPGFFERTLDRRWDQFTPFSSLPNIPWEEPNLRFVDLDGDGHADVLITESEVLTWYPSLAQEGFAGAQFVPKPFNEEEGPALVLADGTQSIYLADMSGDGLTDLVRIRNGEVCYWPNLGYGVFGAKVSMDNAPWFDSTEQFDQRRIRLADIDGSGASDIIYLGAKGVRLYFNQSGNSWSDAHLLGQFPHMDNVAAITAVDLLGRGTACLVWSSPLPGDVRRPIRYFDLMSGQKPHLLVSVRNNMGAETHVTYTSSTKFYLADKAAGQAWITRLPFPVQVVERVETLDRISRNRFVTRYAYHHGFYDGIEREFRGFGRVEQLDTEEFAALNANGDSPTGENIDATSHVPPTLTRTWFHNGAYFEDGRISRQYTQEYYREGDARQGDAGLSAAQFEAILLPDTVFPAAAKLPDGSLLAWDFSGDDLREASRALKGSILRQEVYGLDGTEAADRPYSVSERNYTIECFQPHGENEHAVFFVHPREVLDFHYERKLYPVVDGALVDPNAVPPNATLASDPRVTHAMTLEVDVFGNILKSATMAYGRRFDDFDPLLTAEDKRRQRQPLLTYSENHYTNAITLDDAYRTPLLSEARNYELLNVAPVAKLAQITNLFRFEEMRTRIENAGDGAHDLPYEDVRASGAVTADPYRRMIARSRTLYRKDDLSGALAVGVIEPMAQLFETYSLAFTPGLLDVYERPLNGEPPEKLLADAANVLGNEGGYLDLEANGTQWVPSGRVFYSPDKADTASQELAYARQHFFTACRFRDPFQQTTTVTYDTYDLLLLETQDAAENRVTAGERDLADKISKNSNDYRLLQPVLMMDSNRNRSAVAFDILGMVAGTALMGKPEKNRGDLLAGFVTDLDTAVISAHLQNPLLNPQDILQSATSRLVYDLFAYQKSQAALQPQPSVAYTLMRETHAADLASGALTKIQHGFTYSDGFGREIQRKAQAEPGPLVEGGAIVDPRWLGSGWTVFNNKGKPVRQYEPFFSGTPGFEFANKVGVSPIIFYDPAERVVATLRPNHTYEKVVFDPWRRETWDANDTVAFADPKADPAVGDYFRRLPDSDYLPTWSSQRSGGAMGGDEQAAAVQASVHANTPTVVCFDALGRPYLTVAHNRFLQNGNPAEEKYATRTETDIQGNQRSVTDALGRQVMLYDYDLRANKIHQNSMDAGRRWMLNDVTGKPIRGWDSRKHQIRHEYDSLRRPTRLFVQTGGGAERLAENIIYGESQPDDKALNLRGRAFQRFDDAGVVTNQEYDFKGNVLRGSRQLLLNPKNEVDWANLPDLQVQVFTSSTAYDALNRPVAVTTPDKSVIRPSYNEANLVEQVSVNLRNVDAATLFVSNIDYNAKGQRELIEYGNGARTAYAYDQATFRMVNLRTMRTSDNAVLQNLSYTYDPVGNISAIRDAAHQGIFFANQVASADRQYVYDAVYRLISASGREHIGQLAQPQTTDDDVARMNQPLPTDGQAMRNYSEVYSYDPVGNILKIVHAANNGNWTRNYAYDEPNPIPNNNHLTSTAVGALDEPYSYDAHGNITAMLHLRLMQWNYKDQLHASSRQVVNGGGSPETTYYVYDSGGERVRKITERQAAAGQTPTRKSERIYFGNFEIYREYDAAGQVVTLERETLHVMDAKRRVALVETKTVDASVLPALLPQAAKRYQFDDHLHSAFLELDGTAAIISYEEYYPYGSSSFEAVRAGIDVSPKRYRYIGKERDEENGFSYHGARYCAPWIGRWINPDPAGMADGVNLYQYSRANPIRYSDPSGNQGKEDEEPKVHLDPPSVDLTPTPGSACAESAECRLKLLEIKLQLDQKLAEIEAKLQEAADAQKEKDHEFRKKGYFEQQNELMKKNEALPKPAKPVSMSNSNITQAGDEEGNRATTEVVASYGFGQQHSGGYTLFTRYAWNHISAGYTTTSNFSRDSITTSSGPVVHIWDSYFNDKFKLGGYGFGSLGGYKSGSNYGSTKSGGGIAAGSYDFGRVQVDANLVFNGSNELLLGDRNNTIVKGGAFGLGEATNVTLKLDKNKEGYSGLMLEQAYTHYWTFGDPRADVNRLNIGGGGFHNFIVGDKTVIFVGGYLGLSFEKGSITPKNQPSTKYDWQTSGTLNLVGGIAY